MSDLLQGDCLAVLRSLPDCSVQCCVTSPPYYGLRDYGIDGQIGLEPSPEEYIARLVVVFAEVWRVLKDDGTLWLNLGDSYWGAGENRNGMGASGFKLNKWKEINGLKRNDKSHDIYKPKDLLMIPARVALALQADGWYLRSEIIWHKPNPMPESVRDRPTKAHEMIYLLAKSQKYFYDAEAVKEKGTGRETFFPATPKLNANKDRHDAGRSDLTPALFRNRRDVWTVTTKPYKEAHFATFPPDLIEPCILAGTSERGECPKCGKAWVRVTEKPKPPKEVFTKNGKPEEIAAISHPELGKVGMGQKLQDWYSEHPTITTGWHPSCSCVDESDHDGPFEPIPQTVLDPFNGSGTTGAVSVMHGRQYIGIELNPAYIELSHKRISGIQVALV